MVLFHLGPVLESRNAERMRSSPWSSPDILYSRLESSHEVYCVRPTILRVSLCFFLFSFFLFFWSVIVSRGDRVFSLSFSIQALICKGREVFFSLFRRSTGNRGEAPAQSQPITADLSAATRRIRRQRKQGSRLLRDYHETVHGLM